MAQLIGVKVATLRNWEQHHRQPTGPVAALLTIVEKEPEAALRALHSYTENRTVLHRKSVTTPYKCMAFVAVELSSHVTYSTATTSTSYIHLTRKVVT